MNFGIKNVLNRVNLFFVLYLLVLIACVYVKYAYSKEEIFFAINRWHSLEADVFFKYFTNIGDGLVTVLIVVLLACFFSYRKAFILLTSYGVSSVMAQILKRLFDAPRPKMYFHDQLQHIHFVEGMYVPLLHSFPSGHSVTAFSTALVLTYFAGNKRWGILLLCIAILGAYSRIYVSAHFFEDVMAGSVIGVMVTLLWLSWIDGKAFLHTTPWNKKLVK